VFSLTHASTQPHLPFVFSFSPHLLFFSLSLSYLPTGSWIFLVFLFSPLLRFFSSYFTLHTIFYHYFTSTNIPACSYLVEKHARMTYCTVTHTIRKCALRKTTLLHDELSYAYLNTVQCHVLWTHNARIRSGTCMFKGPIRIHLGGQMK